jgi:hypothetical protein
MGRSETGEAARFGWWWLAVLFVAGLVLGGVIVAVFADDGTPATLPPTSPSQAPTTPLRSPPAGDDVTIVVNNACLRAIDDAQGAYRALRGVGIAARQLDAAGLDQIVQDVQAIQAHLGHDVSACNATVQLPAGESSQAPASSTPTSP